MFSRLADHAGGRIEQAFEDLRATYLVTLDADYSHHPAILRYLYAMRGEAEIALRVGAVVNKHKMAKHFELTVTGESFAFARKEAGIAEETSLDGVYVVRTNVAEKVLDDAGTVLRAEIVHAIRSEFAITLTDVIHRRLMIGLSSDLGSSMTDSVAEIAASEMGWDNRQTADQQQRLREYNERLRI